MSWFIVSPSKYSGNWRHIPFFNGCLDCICAYILGGIDKPFSFRFFKSLFLNQFHDLSTLIGSVWRNILVNVWSSTCSFFDTFSLSTDLSCIDSILFFMRFNPISSSWAHPSRQINSRPLGAPDKLSRSITARGCNISQTAICFLVFCTWPIVRPYSSSLPHNCS